VPQLVYANAVHLLSRQHPHRPVVQLWPHHLITNKMVRPRPVPPANSTFTPASLPFLQPVALNKPTSFAIRQDRARLTTESWRQWAEQREVDEWIAGVAGVLEHGFSEQLRVPTFPHKNNRNPHFNDS